MAALRVGPLADAQLSDSGNASLTQHVGVEVRVATSVFAGREEFNFMKANSVGCGVEAQSVGRLSKVTACCNSADVGSNHAAVLDGRKIIVEKQISK